MFDTLIEGHTVPELVAIFAHEVGHYKRRHMHQGMAIGILHTGCLFFLLSLFISQPGLFEAFLLQHPSTYTGLLFFGMLFHVFLHHSRPPVLDRIRAIRAAAAELSAAPR